MKFWTAFIYAVQSKLGPGAEVGLAALTIFWISFQLGSCFLHYMLNTINFVNLILEKSFDALTYET